MTGLAALDANWSDPTAANLEFDFDYEQPALSANQESDDVAGMAAAVGEKPKPLIRGYAMGSLSMTCYGVDAALDCSQQTGAATIPADVPADQTNI